MMSLHSSMHSSQMNTLGPAMSFFTSCWLLPQKEQYSVFSLEEPLRSAMEEMIKPKGRQARGGLGPLRDHLVDQAVVPGLVGREEIVAIGVALDLLQRLAG